MIEDLDPFERLRQVESLSYNRRYFYYNAVDGTVVKIHNSLIDEPYPHIEMSLEELPDNFTSLNLIDFIVINENNKKKLTTKKEIPARIDTSIPVINVSSLDEISKDNVNLLILQDNVNREFKISLSKEAKENYWRDLTSLSFIFFVTLENDPSILYTSFIVSFSDLLEKDCLNIPFGKYDGSRSNIYTVKFFISYLHVIYDEIKNT